MIRVEIESPFAGDVEMNIKYARACVVDCLKRGEAPYASHLFFTQEGILDDTVQEERKLGMEAGKVWSMMAEKSVVYTDRGMSSGMRWGVEEAQKAGRPVEYRHLGGEWATEAGSPYRNVAEALG